MADTAASGSETTLDQFFGGALRLRQPVKGHRSGTDAVLLAAAVPADFGGLILDAGCGVGAAGLGAALACPQARVDLVDNDAASLSLASQNIAENGLDARVRACVADILSSASRREAGLGDADLVITNPPFYAEGEVRVSPDPARRAAHVATSGGIAAWIAACLAMAAAKGRLILVHRADVLPDILAALEGRAGNTVVLPVHPRAEVAASRVLVRAVKGSRAPFALAPPLVLHEAGGFTPSAERLHRSLDRLAW